MRKKPRKFLWLIIVLAIVSFFIDLPKNFLPLSSPQINLKIGGFSFQRDLNLKKGLDLAGGTQIVFEADMSQIGKDDRDQALEATKNNIERRVNFFGVTEPVIQTSRSGENYRLIVELPGIQAIDEAIDLIGKTAQLEFREQKEATPTAEFLPTGLTGADLARSQVNFDPNTGQPVVSLEFNGEGKGKFAEISSRNVGRIVGIFLDEQPVSLPIIEEPITTGNAIIKGNFALAEAKKLSIQLNAGALPVPIKIIEQRNIGATLGNESVQKSIRAGIIGLLMVAGFMWAYYGKLGLLANFALIIYSLLTLALYKLLPITLTLPGVAGFLLSVGMAVDSNILIFERMKEEIRWGQSRNAAMELAFGRAWDSIRDANVCTLITCFILFNPFNWNFLNTSGLVRGFAVTLGLGIFISLFTGVVVTRTFLRNFYSKGEEK